MKLYGSLTSPFVRAVRIAAIELGLDREIDFVTTVVKPTEPNRGFGDGVNPLRRVPALETDDGNVFIDSRVIVEFLNRAAKGDIVPSGAAARIACFNRHAVFAGATEALVSAMYEQRVRPEKLRWPEWTADLVDKTHAVLDWAETGLDEMPDDFELGHIGLVCLLGYGALRFPEIDWVKGRPALNDFYGHAMRRRSVSETVPPT